MSSCNRVSVECSRFATLVDNTLTRSSNEGGGGGAGGDGCVAASELEAACAAPLSEVTALAIWSCICCPTLRPVDTTVPFHIPSQIWCDHLQKACSLLCALSLPLANFDSMQDGHATLWPEVVKPLTYQATSVATQGMLQVHCVVSTVTWCNPQ